MQREGVLPVMVGLAELPLACSGSEHVMEAGLELFLEQQPKQLTSKGWVRVGG